MRRVLPANSGFIVIFGEIIGALRLHIGAIVGLYGCDMFAGEHGLVYQNAWCATPVLQV